MMLKLGGDIVQALQLAGPGGGTARTGDLQTIARLERKPRVDGVPRHAGRDDLRAPGFTHFWESLVRFTKHQSMVAIVCRSVAIAAFTMFPQRTDTCPFRIFLPVRFSIKARLAIRATERSPTPTPRAVRGRPSVRWSCPAASAGAAPRRPSSPPGTTGSGSRP